MKKYEHYSFDLWMTLIKSNPEFKAKRAEYFFDHFNRKHKTIEEVKSVFREIDVMCNWTNETIGGNIDALEMYAMVLHKLDYELNPLSLRDLQSIYHTVGAIFDKYKPVIYDEHTISTLAELHKRGCTISILSNTGFIKGQTLRLLLNEMGIGRYINFQLYSDELGCSKPDVRMFSTLVQAVNQVRLHNPLTLQQIVHVGDNIHADFRGAKQVGIESLLINSNQQSITSLL